MLVDGIGVVVKAMISPSANYMAIKYDSCELHNDYKLFMVLAWYFDFFKTNYPQNFENSVVCVRARVFHFLNSAA